MSKVVIENPIINSPFDEPTRHFRFSDEGITDEIGDGRRTSSYFVPIAKSKKKGSKQLQFDTEWTQDRIDWKSGRRRLWPRAKRSWPVFMPRIKTGNPPLSPRKQRVGS